MQPRLQPASSSMAGVQERCVTPRRAENLVYQVVTIVSMLMLLGSLWAF